MVSVPFFDFRFCLQVISLIPLRIYKFITTLIGSLLRLIAQPRPLSPLSRRDLKRLRKLRRPKIAIVKVRKRKLYRSRY